MLAEATSFLKKSIKDPAHQERALKLLNSAFSYVELDARKQALEVKKKELAKKQEAREKILKPKSKED